MKDFVEFVMETKQNPFSEARYKTSVWHIEVSQTQSKGLDTGTLQTAFAFPHFIHHRSIAKSWQLIRARQVWEAFAEYLMATC